MQFDSRDFRNALGRFPTGVCVVTTPTLDTSCIGVTVSSFNSVSLDPPLILWSLATTSAMLPAFRDNAAFIVNVLCGDSEHIARRFASQQRRLVTPEDGELVPEYGARLTGSAATFDCTSEQVVEAGDHVIFIGRVQRFAHRSEADALGFFDGSFIAVPPVAKAMQS